MTRLYLIDSNGLAHWLYHATRTKDGENEPSLKKVIMDWFAEFSKAMDPEHVSACIDGKNNWRFSLYPEYKSTRKSLPNDEKKIEEIKTANDAWTELGVKSLSYESYEADDVIATLCNKFKEECEIVIVSTDKDLMQMVCDRVLQYDPRPNKDGNCILYDESKVNEKLGIPPYRVADFLSIAGDSSDDIPGVPGWGKVKAINVINQTRSMGEIIRKCGKGELRDVTKSNQEKFINNIDMLKLSMSLVELKLDVPFSGSLEDLKLHKTTNNCMVSA